jgi:hypothetical protein
MTGRNKIAEPFVVVARHQGDAIRLQRVERVFDLAQTAFGIPQRQHREIAEPSGMIHDQLGRIFVRLAAQPSRHIRLHRVDTGRGDRQHRGGSAGLVHVGKRFLDGPAPHQAFAKAQVLRRRDVTRRRKVMMDVDAERLCLRRGLHQCAGAEHEAAPGWSGH